VIRAAEYLRALIEASDDAIIGLDIDGSIKSWNKGAERVFGYKAEEILREPVSVLIPPARLKEFPLTSRDCGAASIPGDSRPNAFTRMASRSTYRSLSLR
jgi:PAS domain S-box-containing protein